MPDSVRAACEAQFAAHSGDCSGFVIAVAATFGIDVRGQANDIVDMIRTDPNWQVLPNGPAAAGAAATRLVLAGLRGDEQVEHSNHGHVVVVVPGPMARNLYPSAYWGQLGGTGAEFETTNWAWSEHDRDRVTYAAHDLPGS
jgi:hypothetical protein